MSSTWAQPPKRWPLTAPQARIGESLGCGVMVNLGGDIAVAGAPPDGGWRVTDLRRPCRPDWRPRWSGATGCWRSDERRVFRAVSVFPGPFTLEAAEAVAGPGAGAAVLRLVDCSLLVPPRAGPDGRSRYAMLETLRAYGAGLLAEAGEQDAAAAALAGWAVEVAEQAAAGLQTVEGELAAARWLDAEDATMRQVLAWAMEHDRGRRAAAGGRAGAVVGPAGPAGGPVPAAARGRRARRAGQRRVVRRAVLARHGGVGSRPIWPGRWAISPRSATRSRDRGPSRALADGLAGRSWHLTNLGRIAEAADDARRALAMARELGYPAGEALALADLSQRRHGTPATWAAPCGWPGRPGRSRPASPAG